MMPYRIQVHGIAGELLGATNTQRPEPEGDADLEAFMVSVMERPEYRGRAAYACAWRGGTATIEGAPTLEVWA